MKFREHFDRYGWVFAGGVIVIGFLRVLYGREPFCGTSDGHCAREWISALSGWAAVAAAIPTVLYLRLQISEDNRNQQENLKAIQTQISDANRHQQENIEISLAPMFTLTTKMRELVRKQIGLREELRRLSRQGLATIKSERGRKELTGIADKVSALLRDQTLIDFNKSIAIEPFGERYWLDRSVADIESQVTQYEQMAPIYAQLPGGDPGVGVFADAHLDDIITQLEAYLLDRDDKARNYLLRWNQPTAEPFRFP